MGFFKRTKKKDAKLEKAPVNKTDDKKPAPKKKEVVKPKASAPARTQTGNAYKVLLRPIVTEKSTQMAKEGKYVFEVSVDANKIEIKKAIKAAFGTDPVNVRVMRFLGKPTRTRHGYGRRKLWRKAIVTLKEGQSIDVYTKNA